MDIGKLYAIESDNYELAVKKRILNKKSGEMELKTVTHGHCNTLQQACKTLLDNTIKGSKAINNLQQVVKELQEMKKDIDRSLAALNVNKIVKDYEKYNKIKPEMVSEKDSKVKEEE